MLCAISGEAPQEPVASKKSGQIFEKRLILSHLSTSPTDPVTGEDLSADDLIELKAAQIARPRPPTQTSIPALLSTFQNEWDALALEAFALRKQLAQTRQELSTVLYDYEGALRVIARVTKERDEAREALASVGVQLGSAEAGAESMEVDGAGELPDYVVEKVEATQKALSATRRKRKVPGTWVTADEVSSFEAEPLLPQGKSKCNAVAMTSDFDYLVSGCESGEATSVSLAEGKSESFQCPAPITSAVTLESNYVLGLGSGEVKVYSAGDLSENASFAVHSGPVTGLALHPCGDILASVSSDKSYVIYDLTRKSQVTRVFTDSKLTCCAFHPDGHLLAVGSPTGSIKIYELLSGSATSFTAAGPITSLAFSENGIWLAAASSSSGEVGIWDLRKAPEDAQIRTIAYEGGAVADVAWDYTGQFLAIAGAAGVRLEEYRKAGKAWLERARVEVPGGARVVAWGRDAKVLFVGTEEGGVVELKSAPRE